MIQEYENGKLLNIDTVKEIDALFDQAEFYFREKESRVREQQVVQKRVPVRKNVGARIDTGLRRAVPAEKHAESRLQAIRAKMQK